MKKSIQTMILLLAVGSISAQESSSDEKKFDHYIGVQLNGMIRELFNIESQNENVSPYFLNYQLNRTSDNWGLNFGLAYNYEDKSEVIEANVTEETKNNDYSIRIGVEQKVEWGEKWLASLGIDFLYAGLDQQVIVSTTDSLNNPSVSDTKTVSSIWGAGPRGSLHYRLGKRVLIGTEASFYFTSGKDEVTKVITQGGTSTTTVDNPERRLFKFSAPVTLLLTVQF